MGGIMMQKGKVPAILLSIMLICTMSGCRQEGNGKEAGTEEADVSLHAAVSTVTLTEGKYSEEKLYDTWDEKTAVHFTFENDRISAGKNAGADADSDTLKGKAEITGNTVVIRKEGDYVFSGTLADGQIIVDADKEETVRLVFQGVEITCSDSAPVYSKGGNVVITLAEGTENTVEDGSAYTFDEEGEDEPGAAIFAKDDLTFNGNGRLQVIGNYNHGIQCKDDLKFVAGTYIISAANDGIVGKDSVSIRNGDFTIESGDDGIKSTNIDDSDKGYVLIENGTFRINAAGDGIQAETLLRVNNGAFEVTAGGGSQNAETFYGEQEGMERGMPFGGKSGDSRGMQEGSQKKPSGGMEPPEGKFPEGEMTPPEGEFPEGGMTPPEGEFPGNGKGKGNVTADDSDSTEESVSAKGFKSYVELMILDGEFNIDSLDDGIHSDQNVTVQGGKITISTGDDGIHADETLTVDGGSLDILKSYEGLEGFDIIINDGDINVISADDGINAALGDGGSQESDTRFEQMSFAEETDKTGVSSDAGDTGDRRMEKPFTADEDQGASLTVNGGTVRVNADGDGLDSNGDISINGGTVTVHGPEGGGNGTLDYAVSCKITGGEFTGIGSIGMAQAPSGDSTQASIVLRTEETVEAGTSISLKDKDGNVLAETVTMKKAQWFALSSPELKEGETYIFCAGTAEKEVIPTQTVTQFTF